MNERRVARMIREAQGSSALPILYAAILATCAMLASSVALAQDYPRRPIKLVVPWPAGQATDVVARIVTEKMAESMGQPWVAENKPGAAGTIGTELAARAAPDGYTILAASSGPISIGPSVQKLAYEPLRDFEPICRLAVNPYILAVHPSVDATTVADFVALLRRNPGKYTFASSGIASTSHLVAEVFNSAAGVAATHVPYKGSAPAVTDLVAGHVTYTLETFTAVLPHIRAGRLRGLAVTSDKPSPALPEVPTVADALQLPGFDVRGWQGLMAPSGTPDTIRQRLAGDCRKAVESPEVAARMLSSGIEPALLMLDDFGQYLRKQGEAYATAARKAQIRLE